MKNKNMFYGIAVMLTFIMVSCQEANEPYIRYPQVNFSGGNGGYNNPSGSTYEVKKPNKYYWGDAGLGGSGSSSSSRKTRERTNYYMGNSDED